MNLQDAIVVLSGGIKQVDGVWASTDLTEDDDKQSAPGGKLRVLAMTILATKYPEAVVVASGGKGFDVPKDAPEDRPFIAEILRDELIECGVPTSRVILETNSNTTYQQLRELEKLVVTRGWQNVMVVTNRYHIPRLRAMIEAKFSELVGSVNLASAEDVLIETDSARWNAVIAEAYASEWLVSRVEKEKRGIEQIKNGTYQFR